MAKRTGSGSLIDAPPAPPAAASAPTLAETNVPTPLDPLVHERLMKLARILANVEDGMSFADLRAAMSLSGDELRAALAAGLSQSLVRRTGAGHAIRYLVNLENLDE